LHDLHLAGSHFTDKALISVAAIPSLKTLVLENCRLTAEGMLVLSRMNLEHLSLIRPKLSEQAMARLKSVSSLRVLTLHRPAFLEGLSDCKQLRTLTLESVNTEDFPTARLVEELGDLRQLETLSLAMIETRTLPLSAEEWFVPDFGSGWFVPSRHHPLDKQLRAALPNTEVLLRFEHSTLRLRSIGGQGTVTLK
jgi:hypothetical protein